MACLRHRNGAWRVEFFIRGVRTSRTLGKVTEAEARAFAEEYEQKHRAIRFNGLVKADGGAQVSAVKLNRIFDRAKSRAADRKIDFLLTRQDLDTLFARSGGKCEVTHIRFDNDYKPANAATRPWAISIDRIESSKPYILDNCRLVCVAVNMALGQWGMKALLGIAEAIMFKTTSAFEPPKI